MYISATSFSKPYLKTPLFFPLPLFLVSLFPRVLQWWLCSRDIGPGKCLAGELLRWRGSFFILNKFPPLPWSMTSVWAMWYRASEVNKGEQRGELSPIYPGELHPEFECIWPPESESIEMSHGADTSRLKQISHMSSCSNTTQSINNSW